MRLYEGLLKGMEDTLESGNIEAAVIAANQHGSDARKLFKVPDYYESPFTVTEENGKLVFTIDVGPNGIWCECPKMNMCDVLTDVDIIKSVGGIRIIAPDNDIMEKLCKTIIADNVSVHAATEVKDVELFAKNISPRRVIPNMQFDTTVKKLTNCRLEIDLTSSTAARAVFYSIPEFDNVRSESIRYIDITGNPIKFNGVKSNDIMSDARFKKLFDFGYQLDYVDDFVTETPGSVAIKNMKDLRKLVTNKNFYNREFAEWPYRLKPGAKLSDFIDVSQFKDLYSITITDKKMGIFFERVDDPWVKQHASYAYFIDMLKQTFKDKKKGHTRSDINDSIPVTADGWRVIIFRR